MQLIREHQLLKAIKYCYFRMIHLNYHSLYYFIIMIIIIAVATFQEFPYSFYLSIKDINRYLNFFISNSQKVHLNLLLHKKC